MRFYKKRACSMRREQLYLADIVEAADHIASFLTGCDQPRFYESELIRSAVLQKLTIIGEAASKVPETRAKYPSVHDYFGLYCDVVWDTATVNVPILRDEVAAILAQKSP